MSLSSIAEKTLPPSTPHPNSPPNRPRTHLHQGRPRLPARSWWQLSGAGDGFRLEAFYSPAVPARRRSSPSSGKTGSSGRGNRPATCPLFSGGPIQSRPSGVIAAGLHVDEGLPLWRAAPSGARATICPGPPPFGGTEGFRVPASPAARDPVPGRPAIFWLTTAAERV